jgi:hypothetical protein
MRQEFENVSNSGSQVYNHEYFGIKIPKTLLYDIGKKIVMCGIVNCLILQFLTLIELHTLYFVLFEYLNLF